MIELVSPFFGLGSAATPIDENQRSKEFENTIGNLLVAEFQVHRLRERVKSTLSSKADAKQISEFMFRIGDEWFRINVSAERQIEPPVKEEPRKVEKKTKRKTTSPGTTYEAWLPDPEEQISIP